jgi:hypothetical protein
MASENACWACCCSSFCGSSGRTVISACKPTLNHSMSRSMSHQPYNGSDQGRWNFHMICFMALETACWAGCCSSFCGSSGCTLISACSAITQVTQKQQQGRVSRCVEVCVWCNSKYESINQSHAFQQHEATIKDGHLQLTCGQFQPIWPETDEQGPDTTNTVVVLNKQQQTCLYSI